MDQNISEAAKIIKNEIKKFKQYSKNYISTKEDLFSKLNNTVSKTLLEEYDEISKDLAGLKPKEINSYIIAYQKHFSKEVDALVEHNKEYKKIFETYKNSDLASILQNEILFVSDALQPISSYRKALNDDVFNKIYNQINEINQNTVSKSAQDVAKIISEKITKLDKQSNKNKIIAINHILDSLHATHEITTSFQNQSSNKRANDDNINLLEKNIANSLKDSIIKLKSKPKFENEDWLIKNQSKNKQHINMCSDSFSSIEKNIRFLLGEFKDYEKSRDIENFSSLFTLYYNDLRDHLKITEMLFVGEKREVISERFQDMDTASRELVSDKLWKYFYSDDLYEEDPSTPVPKKKKP